MSSREDSSSESPKAAVIGSPSSWRRTIIAASAPVSSLTASRALRRAASRSSVLPSSPRRATRRPSSCASASAARISPTRRSVRAVDSCTAAISRAAARRQRQKRKIPSARRSAAKPSAPALVQVALSSAKVIPAPLDFAAKGELQSHNRADFANYHQAVPSPDVYFRIEVGRVRRQRVRMRLTGRSPGVFD